MNTNDEMDRLLEQGDDLIKRMGIAAEIGKNPKATADQKHRAYKSVKSASASFSASMPDCNFDFDFGKENVAPPPSRRRKFDTLADDQEKAMEKSRVRFKSNDKAKKPHGGFLGKNHTAAFKEAARQRGLDRFASGDNYLAIEREERAAVGDILGQKLARIATVDKPKICKGTQDGQLVIRWFEKFMQGYFGKDKVPAFGTKAYEKMASNFLASLTGLADFELVEQPKGPANRAGKGGKFVFRHPNFILNDDNKLASIVFKDKAPKGAGKGKFSNWSAQEIEDLNKYAAMYTHQKGPNAGKPDWKRVAEKVGRGSEECRNKFKRLSKSK